MNRLIYLAIMVILFTTIGCKKDQYYLYNDVARLQFGPDVSRIYKSDYNLADTLKTSTFYYESDQVLLDTVWFDIYAIGGPTAADRPFKLEQDLLAGADNAVAGTHYKSFDDPAILKNYVIKAGEVHAFVPVILMRDPSLKTRTVTLKFNIVANDQFQLGETSNLWRKVVFTDRLSQPIIWNATISRYYLGDYSVVKHAFMIETTGQKFDQAFITKIYSEFAPMSYWVGVLKTNLIDYNKLHPNDPLKDEFGQLVIFP